MSLRLPRVLPSAFTIFALLVASMAAAQTTGLYLDSQPGDYIGGGQQLTYTPDTATFSASGVPGNLTIYVAPPSTSFQQWVLSFSSPEGSPLTVGSYADAHVYGNTSFTGLHVYGFGHICSTLTGRFDILDIAFAADGTVQRFAADFEQHCGDSDAALFGSVRFNSSISSLVPFAGVYPSYSVTITPAAHGTVTADGLNCSERSPMCSESFGSTQQYFSVTAVPDPGYELLSWDGDCEGGDVAVLHINGPKHCSAVFGSRSSASGLYELVLDSRTGTIPGAVAVGDGRERRYSTATIRMRSEVHGLTEAAFYMHTSDGLFWTADFQAPPGHALGPGDYPNATRAPFATTGPGLDISGQDSCNTLTGHYTVYRNDLCQRRYSRELRRGFRADLQRWKSPLYGSIRFNSDVAEVLPFAGAYSALRLRVEPTAGGFVVGGPLDCAISGPGCTVALATPATIVLQASPLNGYSFVRWTGDCSGTATSLPVTIGRTWAACGAQFTNDRLLSFTASPGSPLRFGQVVTLTTTSVSAGAVEYKFLRYDAATGQWAIARNWSPSESYTWTPTYEDIGHHVFQVWVRLQGTYAEYDDWRGLSLDVTAGLLPSVISVVPSRPSPIAVGSGPVTWTATVKPGAAPPQVSSSGERTRTAGILRRCTVRPTRIPGPQAPRISVRTCCRYGCATATLRQVMKRGSARRRSPCRLPHLPL